MAYREFVSLVHKSTKRDYQARVTQRDKADVAEMAVKFDYDYWDGSRETGYGGYKYDGRWRKVADAMVAAYGIKPGMRVLDVGSGKGFLLHDFRESMPGLEVAGTVVACGLGVHGLSVGQEVCALVNGGGYATYCVAPAPQVLPLPKGLSMIEAAAVPETFFTVWHNVFERGWLSSNKTWFTRP